MSIKTDAAKALGVSLVKGPKLNKSKSAYVPLNDDPKQELRRLVLQHKAMVATKQSIDGQHRDRVCIADRKDEGGNVVMRKGDAIPCRLPGDVQEQMQAFMAEVYVKKIDGLESCMSKTLKHFPLYREFLAKVFGCGPVVAAYLIVFCDFGKATKPSNLRRYCGMAVIDGRLEHRVAGKVNAYNSELRVRLYQMFGAMWKNAAKVSEAAPAGKTSKYLTIWQDYKHRVQHSARAVDGKIVNGVGKTVSIKGFSHSTGWHKACDVFLEDLYIIGRTVEGLPVWPTYQTAKLGYGHGAKVSDGSPRTYTLEEAVGIVGHVGGVARVTAMPEAAE